MKTPAHSRLAKTLTLASLALALLATPHLAHAGTPVVAPTVESPAPSPFHALLKLDVSGDYITPRGLHVENQGLVFQPLFLLFTNLYANPDGFLNDVTLTLGVWSSIHTNSSGKDPGNWNEFDPIAGIAFKFADYWKFEVNYTAFESMTRSYETSQHLELKLSLADGAMTGNKVFSINPYIAYWQELRNKATVVFNPGTSDKSYYFTVGMTPTIDLTSVKFEFPTFINIVGSDFYQKADGSAGGSGLAVFRTGVQASIPLNFVPKYAGKWSLYAGVKYYHLNNPGVLDGNLALGAEGKRDRNLFQFHGGISIFF
ncbi:MAG: hypothetical protein V4662_04965 [Verrucomicrobiota bacterium]